MKFSALLILFLFSLASLNAQVPDSSAKKIYLTVKGATSGFYDPSTGMTSGGSFPSYSFKIGEDGRIQEVGFSGGALRPYLEGNPDAIAELDIFKKRRNNMMLGIGIFVGGGIYLAINGVTEGTGEFTFDPRENKQVEKQQITTNGVVGIGIMITGLIVTAANGIGATKHIERAVEIFNSDLAPKTTAYKIQLKPKLDQTMLGGGLSITW